MDVFFYHSSVTEIPLYNCSALTAEELEGMRGIKHPLRGIASFCVGFPMILVYIACLRVMVKLELIRKACYKIMFVLGHYEITAVLMTDVILAYSLTFGVAFCDAPNLFYTVGCFTVACWAGASYLCLYLAFNRIIEILKLKRHIIDFFFSPVRTTLGILVGIIYTLSFVFFATPAVYTNSVATTIPNPLGFEMMSSSKMRHTLMIADNCGVIVFTAVLYGIFCILLRKKFKQLGFRDSNNHLQHQVFIQSTLLCGFNFSISIFYTIFMFLGENILFPQLCFFVFQFTTGLQALIYLFFNQTILDGVKDELFGALKIKREVTTDMRTNRSRNNEATQPEVNVIFVPYLR